MQAYNLVQLIQYHSETLSANLAHQVRNSPRAGSYENVTSTDLKERVYDIYHHLGEWLTDRSEIDVERRYLGIGAHRKEQGVALSELVWVIILTKNTLREFIHDVAFANRPADMKEKEELLRLLEKFFDHALYAAVIGYGDATEATHPMARALLRAC
jgi:hypothetical protein